jgi:hypothetical protein
MTAAHPDRSRDLFGDVVMLALFLIAQAWSTSNLILLARDYAHYQGVACLVPAALIDGVAFVSARDAARAGTPNLPGWRLRPVAASIAAVCFGLSFAGSLIYAHLAYQGDALTSGLHDALSALPVLLLGALLYQRTRRAAWRRHLADLAAAEVVEAERKPTAKPRRKPAVESANRAAVATAKTPALAPAPTANESANAAANGTANATANEAAASAKPQVNAPTKQERARDYIMSQVREGRGHEVTGAEVDREIGASGTGRSVLQQMRDMDLCPPRGEREQVPVGAPA